MYHQETLHHNQTKGCHDHPGTTAFSIGRFSVVIVFGGGRKKKKKKQQQHTQH